jgi:hypothetical protein
MFIKIYIAMNGFTKHYRALVKREQELMKVEKREFA